VNAQAHDEQALSPILLCAGDDPAIAADLAEATVSLLADRQVVVLALSDPPSRHSELRDAATQAADAACEVLEQHALPVAERRGAGGSGAWQVILDVADEIDASVIVVAGSDGTAAEPGALGREARALAHRARRPLLVLPPAAVPMTEPSPALLAYDGSPSAQYAVRVAPTLLRRRPAVAACVWHSAALAAGAAMLAMPDEVARQGAASLDEASRQEAEAFARDAAAQMHAAGWSSDIAALKTVRSVAGAIVAAAQERDVAVVVTGTRGRSRFAAALLGSTAEGILRHAGRPVLLVPPSVPEEET
jgi:nucleotide-binding universal stress UspA family protein